ncbi:MAG: DUF2179 domain-containing protein [Firmicutes bacterium]|nr:DUF2179 domain-containing protein [Bacillota bacterium]
MELLILCLKVFLVRILDVSLGTMRTIVMVKGKTLIASLIGFVELLIWFLIVREALNTDLDSIWIAISYAGGFATGTYIGGYLSNTFIKGNFGVQVILSENNNQIVNTIRKEGYAVSVIDVKGQEQDKDKYMLFIEIDKRNFSHLRDLIKSLDEKAFIVVNETKMVQNGYFK